MRVLFLCLLFISLWNPYQAKAAKIDLNLMANDFALTFLPLENGEAAFLHLGDGRHYLINTGTRKEEKNILKFMDHLQIDSLDGLILTEEQYAREDFIDKLIHLYGLSTIYAGTLAYDKVKQLPQAEHLRKGMKVVLTPELRMQVIYDGIHLDEGMDFTLTAKKKKFLWRSSSTVYSEQRLLHEKLKDVNILKLPKYALKNSLSYSLLEHIDPQTAIIFKCKDKMPDADLMEVLHQMWIDVYYTEQHGLVIIKFSGGNYEVIPLPQ
ncbi:MAG TPA: hypothetical protein VEY51_11270 [Chondromyces sp.]|nr:hypothetical protein [Chondromyces sp.]